MGPEDFGTGSFIPFCVERFYIHEQRSALDWQQSHINGKIIIKCAGTIDCCGAQISVAGDAIVAEINQELTAVCQSSKRLLVEKDVFVRSERIRPRSI